MAILSIIISCYRQYNDHHKPCRRGVRASSVHHVEPRAADIVRGQYLCSTSGGDRHRHSPGKVSFFWHICTILSLFPDLDHFRGQMTAARFAQMLRPAQEL